MPGRSAFVVLLLLLSGIVSAAAMCGDGMVDDATGETCDDANMDDGDGCSQFCTVEDGWSCTGPAPSSCLWANQTDPTGNGTLTVGEGSGSASGSGVSTGMRCYDSAGDATQCQDGAHSCVTFVELTQSNVSGNVSAGPFLNKNTRKCGTSLVFQIGRASCRERV